MSNLMNTLLQDQRRSEDRSTPPTPIVSRSERIIAAGHAQRTAYRHRNPDADTSMVYGAQVGYLHGEIKRLCGKIDALMYYERDADLLYFEVTCEELGCDVWAGVNYEPGSPERITSAAYFEKTGDPGDPGESEETELMEVWANGIDIAAVLIERVSEQILQSAIDQMRARQAKAREGDY